MRSKRAKQMTLTFVIFLTAVIIAGSAFAYETDSYGGNMEIKSKATGFFRIEKINGQHIFITPEGHGYVPIGINHFHNSKRTDYDQIITDLKGWGFTAGCYQGPLWMWERFPYTKGINIVNIRRYDPEHKFYFDDVFSPEFDEKIEVNIREIVEPQADNKMLIGYFMTDMPMWTKGKFGETWITFFKSLNPESPGGKVWKKWKADNEDKDESDFVPVIAKEVYRKGTGMIRKYDPNHLIFSDRYGEHDFSEEVIRAALPYVDALATQPVMEYHSEYFQEFKQFDKPVYLADHIGGFSCEVYPKRDAPDEEEYFIYYNDYMERLFDLPFIIGYNKCQYIDHSSRPGSVKRGIVKKDHSPYSYVDKLKPIYIKARQKLYDRVMK